MLNKKGLGRGLDALIRAPGTVPVRQEGDGGSNQFHTDTVTGERVRHVALSQIVPSPFQPRKRFDEEQLAGLVESIREHGIIQPLIVREVGGRLELIAGERRWRACQKLELAEVPVISRGASDKEVLELALIENLQREDLNPVEEAEAYARLAREFGLKQEEIAQRVGKNRATVSNAMRLLELDTSLQAMLSQGILSSGHAKAILGIKNREEQKLIADIVVRKKLNVRATERLVAQHLAGRLTSKNDGGDGKPPKPVDHFLRDLQDRFRQRFSTNVNIVHGDKKGRIEIEYYGNEDLDRILQLLGLPSE
ncbi:MAG TPA: ParB/RepB/Spo0J family partition protein [Verrucomicrobiales bacterium]|nr:ParB/RepB/Spo0J family partition protein [Akkermansiaceae bacterium]HRX54456.1 ParB/RepB/Spo0J family partition protein [Verrucomicrobiales bacterium]